MGHKPIEIGTFRLSRKRPKRTFTTQLPYVYERTVHGVLFVLVRDLCRLSDVGVLAPRGISDGLGGTGSRSVAVTVKFETMRQGE